MHTRSGNVVLATGEALVRAGMDVARLNFSHGTREGHRHLCSLVRTAAAAADRSVGVLADLQGPRIRFGSFRDGAAQLAMGADFVISTEPILGSSERASTTYAALARHVGIGDEILADDGRARLQVVSASDDEIGCRIVQGGLVGDHKGLNLPGVNISAPTLTPKDIDDLRFALARGDLGVELPLEQVPLLQKLAVQAAREQAKPVIVATQMLEPMVSAVRPSRAEVSDVANAVLDGADALMLSAETSVGAWPSDAVRTMNLVIAATERGLVGTIPSSNIVPPSGTTRSPGRQRRSGRRPARRRSSRSHEPERRHAVSPRCDIRCPSSCSPLTSRCSVN